MVTPHSCCGSQLAAFVLHCESILWGHVQWLSRHVVEVQLLDEIGQEHVDFISCNDLTNAAPLSHAKNHHFLSFYPVDLSSISIEETIWVEG